jgi:peptide/nickel transport system permease protein
MQRYVARRFLLFIPTLILASMAIFAIMRVLPGDVALIILGGEESSASALEQLEALREELGLKDPLPVQYGNWIWSMVNGQFGGRSVLDREPLPSIMARRVPVTLQLTLYTLIISVFVSVPLGVLAAVYQNKWPDYLIRVTTLAGHAMPSFWLALMLLLFFLIALRWTPPLFYSNLWSDPGNHMMKMIWPSLVLAWGFSSYLTRVTRSNLLEVLRQDYVRTARSKGLRENVVILRHSLRNALIPVVTLSGIQLAALLGGTVILETIFSVPGMGQGIVISATERDYPVIQSLTMWLVFLMLALNLIVDLAYGFLDPRIKYS